MVVLVAYEATNSAGDSGVNHPAQIRVRNVGCDLEKQGKRRSPVSLARRSFLGAHGVSSGRNWAATEGRASPGCWESSR